MRFVCSNTHSYVDTSEQVSISMQKEKVVREHFPALFTNTVTTSS